MQRFSSKTTRPKADCGRALRLINLTDADPDLPLHERLYQRMRSLIRSGTLPRGCRLAPSRALARHLGISRNSALTALDRLVADGWLEARKGSGVYVSYSGVRTAETCWHSSTVGTGPRPFALGTRALDLFPTRLWNQLQSRRWKTMSSADLQLGDAMGWPALREAIAGHVAMTRGLDCFPHSVMVTTSVPAAIDLAVRSLGLAGTEAWVEDPGYHAAKRSLRNCGVRLAPVPVDASGLDVDCGERLAPNAKFAIVTPACQFPTCTTMTKGRRDKLLRWAVAHDAWILEDDYDWESSIEKQLPRPLAATGGARTIYVNSFNSTLFPTLRISYLICPPDLIDRFAAVRVGIDEHSNVPNQMIMADFINGGHLDEHLRRLVAAYPERRAALIGALERELADVVTPQQSAGGTHVVAKLHAHYEKDFVARCAMNGIALDGMHEFRLLPSGDEQVLFGYAGFGPQAIATAIGVMGRAIRVERRFHESGTHHWSGVA